MSDKIFLFLDNVSGSVNESKHEGWIMLHSIDFEVVRNVEFKGHTGGYAPKNNAPVISKITITKEHCTASPQIFSYLTSLQKSKMIIDIIRDSDQGTSVISNVIAEGFTRYEADVCYVSKYKLNGVSATLEKIELTVPALTVTYNPSSSSNKLDKKSSAGFDFQKVKSL